MRSRTFFLVILFLLFLLPAKAQIGEYRSEFAVGGSAGYMISQVGFMPEVPQKQHMNGMLGLAFRYTCEKYFSSVCAVTAELNYVNVGWVQDILTIDDEPVVNTVTGLPEQYKRTISYLQIPVLARMGWGRERKGFQAFFQVGPQFGIYLNEQTTKNYEYGQQNLTQRTSKIIAQETMPVEHKFDYGIAGGGGVEFSHPKVGHFLLEGRYYYGLGDIYGNSKRDYFGRSNLTNILIKLTYLYDIKKTNNQSIK